MDGGGPSGASWRTGRFSIRSLTFALWVQLIRIMFRLRPGSRTCRNLPEFPRIPPPRLGVHQLTNCSHLVCDTATISTVPLMRPAEFPTDTFCRRGGGMEEWRRAAESGETL